MRERPPIAPSPAHAAATESWRERRGPLATRLDDRFGLDDGAVLLARIERRWRDAHEALDAVFGPDHDAAGLLDRFLPVVFDAYDERSADLRRLDRRREIDPGWFHDPGMLGYVCYVDRFADDLAGVADRLDHLEDLGVTYLHLMSVLRAREGDSDGGYAITDYRSTDPRLGTIDDLDQLAAALRRRGMSLCVDVVCNHTADDHEWARLARAGSARHRAYFRVFDDRELPDRYEETLPEVFPELSPGNFTWDDELDAWVWTTFRDFQWDLDHENPDVFAEMLDVMCFLANRGVDVLRLDAVPFLWKRLGTDCQNQPEAHRLVQAWRALLAIVAPGVLCKAEAIVPPGQLVQYLGGHDRHRPEADLAYHNQLMVMSWNGVATRRADLMTRALGRMRTPPPGTAWCTYVRIHDDIGWAVDDADAAAVGLDPAAHRAFLAAFFRGDFPGSYARGAAFMTNPLIGDERTSGMTSALAGLAEAVERDDPLLVDQAVRRIRLLYAIAMGWGGIPLLWMGDEIGLGNDTAYVDDPDHADDSRWLHRPAMDWSLVETARRDERSPAGRILRAVRSLADQRAATPPLRSGGATTTFVTGDDAVFGWLHDHPAEGCVLGLANLHDDPRSVGVDVLDHLGPGTVLDVLDATGEVVGPDGRIALDRLGVRWVVTTR
ncbi:MAG: alpha-amylase family protein [Actinomycetota bacterium]